MTENNLINDDKLQENIINELVAYTNEHEENELIINKLIKTIDNNIKNNNQQMINKLDEYYE